MAIFLGVHKLSSEMTDSQATEGFEKYKESAKAKGLTPLSAIYSLEKGFAYCQTEADSADEVRQAHQGAEIPLEDVIEVKALS
jgi:hypothetical protein